MAAGRDTPTSDVDLLVDLRDASLDRLLDLSSKLASLVGRPVDVHRLEDVEADPSMFATALADGRVLVDREGRWPRLQEQRSSVERNSARQQETRARAALAGIDRLLGT
jgi:predicted nucleotidyltransferase